MKTKSNAKKTTKKNAANKKQNRAVDWQMLISLIESGMSAVDVAKKMGRTVPGNDPGHSIRALASRARTQGYRVNGKLLKLKVARFGVVKATKKTAAKKNVVVMKKAAKKKAALPVDGKTAAAGGQ
jgi:hypothetical protein